MAKRRHHKPSAKAKRKYYALIIKSYKRLHRVVAKHSPKDLM